MASALAIESLSSSASLCEPDPAFAWEVYAEETRPRASWRLDAMSSSLPESPHSCNTESTGQVEYSTSASSSHMPQMVPAESCEELKPKDDDADDSTQASEGPRWADFEESDDDKDLMEEHEMKHQLAEIIDHEEDEVKVQSVEKDVEKTARKLWADLVDDSDEGEFDLGFPQGDGEAEAVVADTVAVSSSKRRTGKKSKKAKPQELVGLDSKAKSTYMTPAEEARNGKKSSGKGKRQEAIKVEERHENTQRKSKDAKGKGRSDASSNSVEFAGKGSGKAATSKGSGKGACRSGKGAAKGAAKGAGKGSGAWSGDQRFENASSFSKRQCQYTIGIEEDTKFKVVRRLLGPKGQNMKAIADKTGSRLRLRGRGSKFLEGPEWDQKESTDDLMLCISSQDAHDYEVAQKMVSDLLKGIYREYENFCRRTGQNVPVLQIQLHEGAREGSR